MNRRSSILVTLGLLSAALLLSGCLFGSSSKKSRTGNYVSPEEISQIEPGTSKAQVLATLGEPSTKSTDANVDVWRWNYTEQTSRQGSLLFLFSSSSETEEQAAVFVEFRDDLVQRVWQQ